LRGRRGGAVKADISTKTPADPQVSPTAWFSMQGLCQDAAREFQTIKSSLPSWPEAE
jgi:hypothetical protein